MAYSLLVLFTTILYANAQGTGKNCQYSFTVPDKQGVCTSNAAGLDQRVTALKQDLGRQRLQVVAQNSIFQGKISRLQSENQAQASLIANLQTDLQQLRGTVLALTTGSGTGPTLQSLQQQIFNAKTDLNTVSNNLNDKLLNLTTEMTRAAIEETKVHTAIETQVITQTTELSKAAQRITTLENQVQNIQNTVTPPVVGTTPGTGSTATSLQMTQLLNQIQALDRDVRQVDQKAQQQFSTLNGKTNLALLTLSNHTRDIDDAKIASRAAMARIQTTETRVSTLRTTFIQFRTRIDPQVQRIDSQVTILRSNTTFIQNELTGVGTRLLNMQVKANRDVTNLQTGNSLLASQISRLQNSSSIQAGEVLQLRVDLNRLKLSNPTAGPGPATPPTPATPGISTTAFNQLKNQFSLFQKIAQQQLTQTRTDLQSLAARITQLHG